MGKKVAIAIGIVFGIPLVLILGVLGIASTKPDTFRAQRSITISAPADKIYPLVADFHQWDGWSPWEKMDPTMKKSFNGSDGEKGATYDWEGNDKVGKGKMTVLNSSVPKELNLQLNFIVPFECENLVDFTFEEKDGSTQVTWAMHGPSPFMSKVIQVFASMDSMVGKDFESGLASLKALAEK